MKLKKPIVLSAIAIIVIWSGLIYAVNNTIAFLRDTGKIHYSFNSVERFHRKNIEHYEKVADYMLDNILYFNYPFVNQKTGEVFEVGDVKQWQAIFENHNDGYLARLYDVERSEKSLYYYKDIELANLPTDLLTSLNKLYQGCVDYVSIEQTQSDSLCIVFHQKGGNLLNRQTVAFFPDDEQDLDFLFGYKITYLEHNNWYYLALGEVDGGQPLLHKD